MPIFDALAHLAQIPAWPTTPRVAWLAWEAPAFDPPQLPLSVQYLRISGACGMKLEGQYTERLRRLGQAAAAAGIFSARLCVTSAAYSQYSEPPEQLTDEQLAAALATVASDCQRLAEGIAAAAQAGLSLSAPVFYVHAEQCRRHEASSRDTPADCEANGRLATALARYEAALLERFPVSAVVWNELHTGAAQRLGKYRLTPSFPYGFERGRLGAITLYTGADLATARQRWRAAGPLAEPVFGLGVAGRWDGEALAWTPVETTAIDPRTLWGLGREATQAAFSRGAEFADFYRAPRLWLWPGVGTARVSTALHAQQFAALAAGTTQYRHDSLWQPV